MAAQSHKLVLKYFRAGDEAPPGALFQIGGRRGGVIGWVLRVVGLAEDVSMTVTPQQVIGEVRGKEGHAAVVVPLHRVAATSCGHERPVKDLIYAGTIGLASILLALAAHSTVLLVVGLLVSAALIVKYALGKSLWIRAYSFGGAGVGVGFRPGLLEQISIDPVLVERAIETLNTHVLFAREPMTRPDGVLDGTIGAPRPAPPRPPHDGPMFVPPAPAVRPAFGGRPCPSCGSSLEADSQFCAECGAKAPSPAAS